MKIAVTGGAGYVGSALVPHLVIKGHEVTVLDTFWFGDRLPNDHVTKIKGDIRFKTDLAKAFKGQDAVIHLACVSNDPSSIEFPELTKSINLDCFRNILLAVKQARVQRFIYASSSSVYGVSDAPDVREETPKHPLTDYSKYKLACENALCAMGTGGTWTILRPATVCGPAPRMRFDLVVNIMTIQALVNAKIRQFGKDQKRPNIHIDDMVAAYDFILSKDEKEVDQQIYNVGFENLSVQEIAEKVKRLVGVPARIDPYPVVDPRSYHINSDKIKQAGFFPAHSISNAIRRIASAYKNDKYDHPLGNPVYYNIQRMKELHLK